MSYHQKLLFSGGLISLLITLLHVGLCFFIANQTVLVFFGAPEPVLTLSQTNPAAMIGLTMAVALIFLVFSFYAWSGAGLIRRLPFLRPVLLGIGVLYTLRGLMIVEDVYLMITADTSWLNHPAVLFSIVSLLAGWLYLRGIKSLSRLKAQPMANSSFGGSK